jgi:hypothetical protein
VKNISILASIMVSTMMWADINLIDLATLSLILDKKYNATIDFINELPEQQQGLKERLIEFFKAASPLIYARQTVYFYANLGARATLREELAACQHLSSAQDLARILIPTLEQQAEGAHSVTWYLEKAKHYAERDGELLRTYMQRLKDALSQHEARYGKNPDFYAAQGYIKEFEQIQSAWQEFDHEVQTLETILHQPLDPVALEQQAIKVDDFQTKRGLILNADEATNLEVQSHIRSTLNLLQRVKELLVQTNELIGSACTPTQEEAQIKKSLEEIAKSSSILPGSKIAIQYGHNINSCLTALYEHIKDRKITKEEEALIVAVVQKLQKLGVVPDALQDAEQRLIKAADTIAQGKFKQYEDVELEIKSASDQTVFYYIVPERGNKQSYYSASDFIVRLDKELADLQQTFFKEFTRAGEYYFILQGKTMDEVLQDPNIPAEEAGFFDWAKKMVGIRPLDQRIKGIAQQLEALQKRLVWFKELILLLPQAENKVTSAGLLGVETQDPQQMQRKRELLEIFAYSPEELEESKLFEGKDIRKITGNALPYVWLGYTARYQQAYGAGKTSPIIDHAAKIIKAFNDALDKAHYKMYAIPDKPSRWIWDQNQ